MASPQVENGFTRIANELFPALVSRDFSGAECRAIWAVIRMTYGYHKLEVALPSQKLAGLMGVSDRYARGVLSSLVQKGVLELVRPAKGPNPPTIRFIKNYDRWKVRPDADMTLWDEFEPEPREPDASVPDSSTQKAGKEELGDPASRNPESRISGSERSGFPAFENGPEALSEAVSEPVEKTPKEKGIKKNSKETLANPSQKTETSDSGGAAPESPGTGRGRKRSKTVPLAETPFVTAALDTLYAILGEPGAETRAKHVRTLLEIVAQEGEYLPAVALREAIREVVFKRHNEKSIHRPASMAMDLAFNPKKHGLKNARQHRRKMLLEIRKRGLERGIGFVGAYRYQPLTGWAVPPSLDDKEAFYLQGTALVAYICAHMGEWKTELARLAGLPAGGAGPGPEGVDLTCIGRDLNDLEDPHDN